MMPVRVKVDRQGRVIIPLRERERLGVATGGVLELVPTPEGVLLERRRSAEVRTAADGLPVILIEDAKPIGNEESLDAIHAKRDRA